MTVEEAGGQRFITSNGPYSGNDVCVVSGASGTLAETCNAGDNEQVLNKAFPDLPNVPKGDPCPEYRKKLVASSNFVDGTKAAKMLGIKYRSLDETMRDTALSLRARFNF